MKETDETETSGQDARLEAGVLAFFKDCMKGLFEIYYLLYRGSTIHIKSGIKPWTKLGHYLSMVLNSVLILSLSFPCAVISCSDLAWIYDNIPMIRLDYLASKFDLAIFYFYLIVFASLFALSIFIYLLWKVRSSQQVDFDRPRLMIILVFKLFTGPMFIPAFAVSCGVFKQTVYPSALDYQSPGSFGLAAAGVAFLLVSLNLVHSSLHYEQFLVSKNVQIRARAHSRVETLKILAEMTVVLSHFFLHDNYGAIHLVLITGVGLAITAAYIYSLPFYNIFVNFSHAACFYFPALGAFAQLLAIGLDQEAMILILLLFLAPFNFLILSSLIKKRMRYIRENYVLFKTLQSVFQYELVIRFLAKKYLKSTDKEEKERTLKTMHKGMRNLKRSQFQNKFADIYEFLFSLLILKKEALARVQLSKAYYKKRSLETCFLFYKYNRFLNDHSVEYKEEIDFLKYNHLFLDFMGKDLEACNSLLLFLAELKKEKLNPIKLEQLNYDMYDSVKKCKKSGDCLLKHYPNNKLANERIGSFLSDILNDEVRGNELFHKADVLSSQPCVFHEKREFSFFEEDLGIILVHINPERAGKIKYLNKPAAEILGVPASMALNSSFSSYLPYPNNDERTYKKYLVNIFNECQNTDIDDDTVPFLVDFKGNLIETLLKIKLVALNTYPFLIYALKMDKTEREVCLLDANLALLSHSSSFPDICELKRPIINKKLRDIFNFEKFVPKMIVKYRTTMTHSLLYLIIIPYIQKHSILYLTNSCAELENWGRTFLENTESVPSLMKGNSIKSSVISTPMVETGILKHNKVPKKNMQVKFETHIECKEITMTDFPPGHSEYSNTKDGYMVQIESEERTEDIRSLISRATIVDLDNLQSLNEINKKPNARSKASSKASGRSATSTAHHQSSKIAMIMLKEVTSSVRRFYCLMFLAFIMMIGSSIGMHIFGSLISSRYIDSVLLNRHVERRILTFEIAMHARDLMLGTKDKPEVLEQMKEDLATFKAINTELRMHSEELNDPHIEYVFNHKMFKVWEKMSGTIYFQEDNLKNLVDNIERHSESVLFDVNPSSLFYLYMNGIGDTYRALNFSYTQIGEVEEYVIEDYLRYYLIVIICSVIIMVLCLLIVIAPAIFAVERTNQKIWQIFFRVPLDIVNEIRGKGEERLEAIHYEEIEDSVHEKSFTNLPSRELLRAGPQYSRVLYVLACYYCVCCGYLTANYILIYTQIQSTLEVWHGTTDWTGQRVESVNSAYFWLQESKYLGSNESYFDVVNEWQIFYSPVEQTKISVDTIKYSENKLMNGPFSKVKNSEIERILLDTADSDLAYLKKGLHSALLLYMTDTLYYLQRFETHQDLSLNNFRTVAREIRDVTMKMRTLYEEEFKNRSDQVQSLSSLLLALFIIASMLIYFAGILPAILQVEKRVEIVWDMVNIIPAYQRKKILSALK